ncbi:hypothetical protein [Nocardia noduli]|uniref:hypothetical protein n=1 Tax=Nocardia noduli TaxID=2815722 RepID=UPI001C23C29A|nr:hypothetical protein [Nocardia noduli]
MIIYRASVYLDDRDSRINHDVVDVDTNLPALARNVADNCVPRFAGEPGFDSIEMASLIAETTDPDFAEYGTETTAQIDVSELDRFLVSYTHDLGDRDFAARKFTIEAGGRVRFELERIDCSR